MKCPSCKLENPDSAERCDCGYDFASYILMYGPMVWGLVRVLRGIDRQRTGRDRPFWGRR